METRQSASWFSLCAGTKAARWLVQLLLPLAENDGKPFANDLLAAIRNERVERFGGLTAYARSSAQGCGRIRGRADENRIKGSDGCFEKDQGPYLTIPVG